MDELRLESVAASVAAWHNRHPLARRIGMHHVQSVGFVRLPFAKGPKGLAPAFSEDFMPPWRTARIARWAKRHGREGVELDTDAPRREVAVDRAKLGAAGGALVMLTVRTAEVDAGGEPERVLLGPGARPAVLGRRLASVPRLGGLIAAGVVALGVAWQVLGGAWPGRGGEAVVAVAPAASAASAAASAALPAVAASAPLAVASAPAAASAPAVAEAPASAPAAIEEPTRFAAAPPAAPASAALPPDDGPPDRTAPPAEVQRLVDVEPRWGRVDLPPKPLILDKPKAPVYGLASAVLRTDGEGERVQGLMVRLLGKAAVPGVHVERLQVGDDWRVVGYPFTDKAAAERAAALLLKGGLRTEVIDF